MQSDHPDEKDLEEMDHRLDEVEEEIQEAQHEAQEHGTIPGKHEPTFIDPDG
jgi:tetrahydromethanopterin S-methyltransferase subunit G